METKYGRLFSDKTLNQLRSQFKYVEVDCNKQRRLFFDNAGGSLRLIQAEEVFYQIDAMPDASEHANILAKKLLELEDKGRADLRVIFNAKKELLLPVILLLN